ncbi:hypothetical protein ACFMQL_17410 [Nonomuraea fastidiosa]|uniref:hypothetical protein n=1 Tax=Nonomuraea fastidiosa TaxID=46173 RepID=UPI003672BB18
MGIPTLTLAQAPAAATKLQVEATLTPTPQDSGAKEGADVTTSTTVPAKAVVYKIPVATGTTGKVSVRPTQLELSLLSTPSTSATCTPTSSTEVLEVPIGNSDDTGTDVVKYSCDVPTGSTDTSYEAREVDIKVVLTPPSSATANADASITWTGTIQSTGDTLTLPTGFPTTGAKMFATIKASGAGAPSTATGEATFTPPTTGNTVTTLPTVTIKVKPTTTGTVKLTAGDLAFGTSSTSPALKCTAPTTGLKEYSFTVSNSTTSPTPSPSPTTTTPRPTQTHTATVTITPSATRSTSTPTRNSQTPKAGADTGAGGMAGPDGRLFILTGTALVAAAAIGGLVLRRRSIRS